MTAVAFGSGLGWRFRPDYLLQASVTTAGSGVEGVGGGDGQATGRVSFIDVRFIRDGRHEPAYWLGGLGYVVRSGDAQRVTLGDTRALAVVVGGGSRLGESSRVPIDIGAEIHAYKLGSEKFQCDLTIRAGFHIALVRGESAGRVSMAR